MGCRSCSRRSKRKNVDVPPEPKQVTDFSLIGPSQTSIRSGNGQKYSISAPLVKMRPPAGWSLWVLVKGHKHYIERSTAQDMVSAITNLYLTNDVAIDPSVVWFNANRIWVSKLSARHVYATPKDLEAISELLVEPLIWSASNWSKALSNANDDGYNEDEIKAEVDKLIDMANHPVTGCEICYDDLTETSPDYTDQDATIKWLNERFANIVEKHAKG